MTHFSSVGIQPNACNSTSARATLGKECKRSYLKLRASSFKKVGSQSLEDCVKIAFGLRQQVHHIENRSTQELKCVAHHYIKYIPPKREPLNYAEGAFVPLFHSVNTKVGKLVIYGDRRMTN